MPTPCYLLYYHKEPDLSRCFCTFCQKSTHFLHIAKSKKLSPPLDNPLIWWYNNKVTRCGAAGDVSERRLWRIKRGIRSGSNLAIGKRASRADRALVATGSARRLGAKYIARPQSSKTRINTGFFAHTFPQKSRLTTILTSSVNPLILTTISYLGV